MNLKYGFIGILLLWMAFSCQTDKNKTELGETHITSCTIPFKMTDDIILIKVAINDSFEAQLIFDSGETTITLSNEFAAKLEQNQKELQKVMGMASEKFFSIYDNLKVTIGDFSVDSIKGGATDLSNQSRMLGTRVDGLIGYQVLKNYVCSIDYDKQSITLSLQLDSIDASYTEVPLYVSHNLPVIYSCVSTFIDSTVLTGKFVLDFGANNTLVISTVESNKNNLYEKIGKNFYSGNVGTTGRHMTHTGRMLNYQIADYSFNQVPVSLGTVYSGFLGQAGYLGLIGNGFLKRFNAIYNVPDRKLYLSKSKMFDQPFIVNCTGFSLVSNLSFDSFFVNTVYENSPASALDIRKGDYLKRINGKSAYDFSLAEIKDMLKQPGKTFELVLIREDEEISKTIELEDII